MDKEPRFANPKIIELEGMAMTGFLKNVKMEDCEKPPGWKKLVVSTIENETLSTNCMEPDAAKRNFMVFTLYIRNWAKLIKKDYDEEELNVENIDLK